MKIHSDKMMKVWATSVALFLGACFMAGALYQHRRRKHARDELDWDDGEPFESDVPSHVQRLLYKEERRKQSTRHLSMKKPLYDNVEMYSPDGTLLCTISNKKAAWYIKKNLGRWKVETKAVELLFEPKGQPNDEDTYNTTHKKNICVVCGESEDWMRHYIVPYCYRQLFPTKYKTHMPHDIVILCPDCHLQSEQQTQMRQRELDCSIRKDTRSIVPRINDHGLHKVRSAALALHKRSGQLPQHKILEYEQLIKEHFGLDQTKGLSEHMLEKATKMQTSVENRSFIPSPNLVVSALANDPTSIERFVVEWRKFFVATMQPRFLPVGWNIRSPVHI
jgi:exonuclease 3'-5' domain-containing protein 2